MNKRKHPHRNRPSAPASHPRTSVSGIWIYGRHAGIAALCNSRRKIIRVLVRHADPDVDGLNLPKLQIQPEVVDRQSLEAVLPPDAVHQGLAVLVAPLPPIDLPHLLTRPEYQESVTLLVLDQAHDPRNIGAVLRTAAAFGVAAVLVPDRGSPDESGPLAKAATGALEIVPLVRVTNLVRTLEDLKHDGFWCIGLDGHTDREISDIDFTGRIVITLGAEGKGLRRLTRETCDHLGKIPISNDMESLNLSNAAAITLYEASRQRLKK